MHVIRPARRRSGVSPLAVGSALTLIGLTAVVLMAIVPSRWTVAMAAMGVLAALGLGSGAAFIGKWVRMRRRLSQPGGEDVARLLTPVFGDDYVLILGPRLPGASADLAGLLVGPAGVRALVARRWNGRYRVRGRGWEYDSRSRHGWVRCRTNPSFDADTVATAVTSWARETVGDGSLPIAPAVVFPRSSSVVLLEEPSEEVVTTDNAPWWAQRIGRVRRMDQAHSAAFVQRVIDAADAGEHHPVVATAAR